jgi:hypothetical protein
MDRSAFLKLAALALTAIAFLPSGAHMFELPAKMALNREEYFLVQGIYSGWAWFVIPIAGAIVANARLFVLERRRDSRAAFCALGSAALIALSLVVFFIFVFPGNQATANWTRMPSNWEELRLAWEYGHAANALLMFTALLAVGRALIGRRD